MDFLTGVLVGGVGVALYLSWNIGANDVANSMASAVGAKAITLKQAIVIAVILEFVGAFFLGSHVSATICKGIINPNILEISKEKIAIGYLAAMMSAGMWITLSTWRGLPVSTTHAIVGGMIGIGIEFGGFGLIQWYKIGEIVLSWILSPLMAIALSFIIFKIISRFVLSTKSPGRSAKKAVPIFIAVIISIIIPSLLLKTKLKTYVTTPEIVIITLISIILSSFIGYILISGRIQDDKYEGAETSFKYLQILSSCYISLAHGANDVANAIGPLAVVWAIGTQYVILEEVVIPPILLALGGIGIGVGVGTWGYKVIGTIGSKITSLTNTRGFAVDFGTATTVLIASIMGLPVSTSHAVVGSVCGVGMSRGIDAINLNIIKRIIVVTIITIPVSAISGWALCKLLIFAIC